jgi:hypothetical protein
MDIKLNSNFDVFLDDRNDLAIVEGREAFEQRVAVRVTAYFHEIIGSVDRPNVLKLVELQTRRVANAAEGIERVVQVSAEYSEDEPNTVLTTIIYETGDEFVFSLSE